MIPANITRLMTFAQHGQPKAYAASDMMRSDLEALIKTAYAPDDHDWQPMKTAPRDGTNILLAWGQDGVSQGKFIPGLPKPWQFIDTNDGITWLINYAVDNEYGPTHWLPMPKWTRPSRTSSTGTPGVTGAPGESFSGKTPMKPNGGQS